MLSRREKPSNLEEGHVTVIPEARNVPNVIFNDVSSLTDFARHFIQIRSTSLFLLRDHGTC